MPYQEYKEIVGTAAAVTTIAQCFSPVFLCYDMYKQKSTKNIDSTPFIGGIGITAIMLQHGILLNDPAMIPVNIFGFCINLFYFFIYLFYSSDKNVELVKCAKTGVFAVVLIGYAQLDEPKRAEFNLGIIITVLMMVLIAAPLFSLGEIIRTKSTAKLPFPLILSGTVVSCLWLLYGFIIENIFLQLQNVAALILCSIQLSLFAIYPRKPVISEEKKEE